MCTLHPVESSRKVLEWLKIEEVTDSGGGEREDEQSNIFKQVSQERDHHVPLRTQVNSNSHVFNVH